TLAGPEPRTCARELSSGRRHYRSERRTHVLTDDELIAETGKGSQAAFEALFERYREPVWRFFRRRTPDTGVAQELSQDTFVALLEAARRYKPKGMFRSYLFGVAYNVLLA